MRGVKALVVELGRRHVLQSAAMYAVAAWIVIEVAVTVAPLLRLPAWTPSLVLALALLGFPLVLVFAWIYDFTAIGTARQNRGQTKEAAVALAPLPRSIAVLPFVDMSPDRDQEHFSDGIAEEILNVLAKIPELRVVARTSAFAFKGRQEDVRSIGSTLRVATILEGSLRKSGNQIRVTAQLIDVANGYHLWSERFDRELDDVFAIQDEIAANVAKALKVVIGSEAVNRKAALTDDVRAYEFYLRGRFYIHGCTYQAIKDAVRMFSRAIEIDPDYAIAYAGAADAASSLYVYWEHDPKHLATALAYSGRALQLAPNLPEAHVAKAYALSMGHDYDAAAREFERALALDPNLYDAYYLYARSRWAAGDLAGAEQHFLRAAEVRPEDYAASVLLVSVYHSQQRNADAKALAARTFQRVERHVSVDPKDVRALCFGAGMLIELNREPEARAWLHRAVTMDSEDAVVRYNVACTYAKLLEADHAFGELAAAFDRGWCHPEWLMNDGDWTHLHEDPRFTQMLDRISDSSEQKMLEQPNR